MATCLLISLWRGCPGGDRFCCFRKNRGRTEEEQRQVRHGKTGPRAPARYLARSAGGNCVFGATLAGDLQFTFEGENTMLHWSLIFLIIAIVAAVLGFGGIAGTAAGIAKILFFVFLVIWLLAFVVGRRSI